MVDKMKHKRETAIPSLLIPYTTIEKEKKRSSKGDEGPSTKTAAGRQMAECAKNRKSPSRAGSRSGRVLSAGERHQRELQRAENKRLECVADRWDVVKAEARLDRTELLQKKVALQHQLIHAQDVRARLRRQAEDDHRRQKREEDKKAKDGQLAGLQETFKQSIANDRVKQQNEAKSSKSAPPGPKSPPSEGGQESVGSAPSTPSSDSTGRRESRSRGERRGHRGYLPSDSYAPATSPMKELEDEEDDKENGGGDKKLVDSGVVTPADLGSVPWHHAQLYKMYGRNADYYIHPKMAQEKKKVVNPTLKSQKGHMGASHIWTTLRGDSMAKLHRTDRRFPQELKDAFSSHVREGINKHQRPVFRNFTETEDVPDLKRLMDQSLLRKVRVLRHKTELMYRSSQTNNDRTKVLLFNSPLPDATGKEEGIHKYLPSWDDMGSECTEATYKRWLQTNTPRDDLELDQEELTPRHDDDLGKVKMTHPTSVLSPLGSDVSEGLQNIWHSIMARNKPRPPPRLHFLTEEESKTDGAFLEKLGLDKDKLDQGRVDLLPTRRSLPGIKSQSAMESRTTNHSVTGGHPSNRHAESAGGHHHGASSRYTSQWQPLSMNALMEYKDHLDTEGVGDYHQGRPRMWKSEVENQHVEII